MWPIPPCAAHLALPVAALCSVVGKYAFSTMAMRTRNCPTAHLATLLARHAGPVALVKGAARGLDRPASGWGGRAVGSGEAAADMWRRQGKSVLQAGASGACQKRGAPPSTALQSKRGVFERAWLALRLLHALQQTRRHTARPSRESRLAAITGARTSTAPPTSAASALVTVEQRRPNKCKKRAKLAQGQQRCWRNRLTCPRRRRPPRPPGTQPCRWWGPPHQTSALGNRGQQGCHRTK